MILKKAYARGLHAALMKFALAPAKQLPNVSRAIVGTTPGARNPLEPIFVGRSHDVPTALPQTALGVGGTAASPPGPMTRFLAEEAAWRKKLALDPPTQVDAFMGAVESGKDVPPEPAMPPMSHAPGEVLPALDGTTPLSISPPTPPGLGSTVGDLALSGDPAMQPPPSMGALGG